MIRFLLSFISVLVGWAAGFVYFVIYMAYFTPWQRPTDVEAILFWSGIFVILDWLLFVLPFVFLVKETSGLLRLPAAIVFGGIAGLVNFLLLVGWWTGFWSEGLYLGYASVVGAVTGGTYAVLLRFRRRNTQPGV